MDVAIHETGHSLDLLDAYGEQLSGTYLSRTKRVDGFSDLIYSQPRLA